ncbi:MAG: EAL and HDOD domain-containing protein [Candidatus Acidulodesulfobacterium sp.]
MKNQIYIGRQSIIKPDKTIFGFEILFRQTEENSANIIDNLHATANVLENLFELGLDKIIGDNIVFINIYPHFLNNMPIDLLQKEKTIFEILETSEINAEELSIIKECKSLGYKFALDDFVLEPKWETVIELADYIKIDVRQYSREEIRKIVSSLKKYNVKLIAEKVETKEEFDYFDDLGFDLFQGYFFQKPFILTDETLSPDYNNLLLLLKSFQNYDSITKIENQFKNSPELVFRLFKLVNSASYAFATQISSLRQAIVILGYDTLYKWLLTIILAGKSKNSPKQNPLLELAIIKSKTMEDIFKYIGAGDNMADKAFLTGIFSLIPAVFQKPIDEILKHLSVDKMIYEALVEHTGELGYALNLMDAVFQSDYKRGNQILSNFKRRITMDEVLRINTRALIYWEDLKNNAL